MVDEVIVGKTRIQRKYASYYTDSVHILAYMSAMLKPSKSDRILEPAAGSGAFIRYLLDKHPQHDLSIMAYDLNPKAVESLNENFKNEPTVTVQARDTLIDDELDLIANAGGIYNKVIANPPYGAWQDPEHRKILKKRYGGYVKESYTLFLERCLDLLKYDGRLVFIIPDTFLALNRHRQTRELLLNRSKIIEIALFPSKFFPGVNFGYSNLCIITLDKKQADKDHSFNIVKIKKNDAILSEMANGHYDHVDSRVNLIQSEILKREDLSFNLSADRHTNNILASTSVARLGDVAKCVTGFYSGDNANALAVLEHKLPSLTKYKLARESEIEWKPEELEDPLRGLLNGKLYIPLHKGGRGIFEQKTEWLVSWDSESINKYKTDKRARFQNSKFYFQDGIAVPMVRSKRLKATKLDKRLFDQSVVGIFPDNPQHTTYLLALLNSDIATKFISAINHTTNNSANYLKKIPVIIDELAIKEVEAIMSDFKNHGDVERTLKTINLIFNKVYGGAVG